MDNVLGHDIDGRPLRAGDEVVLIEAPNPNSRFKEGQKLTIMRHAGTHERVTKPGTFGSCFNPKERTSYLCEYECTRKLHDDHRLADESFEDMMNNLKSPEKMGAPQ